MSTFEITSPEGVRYRVTGPEGATEEDAFGQLQAQLQEEAKPKPPANWGKVVGSLPSQMLAGAGTAIAETKLAASAAKEVDFTRPVDEGFAETTAGAVTGLVRPGTSALAEVRFTEKAAEAKAEQPKLEEEVKIAKRKQREVTPENMTFWQQALSSAAASSLPILGAIAAAPFSPPAAVGIGVIGGGLMQGGSTFNEALEAYRKQGLPDVEAKRKALFSGGLDFLLEGLPEAIPLHFAFQAGSPFFKRLWKTVIAEAGQEGATQLLQDLHAWKSYNPDMTFKEGLENVKLAIASGAIMGGVIGGAGHAVAIGDERAEEADAKKRGSVIDNTTAPKPDTGPTPVVTQPISNEAQALIDSIDATLAAETITPEQTALAREQIAKLEKDRNSPPLETNAPMLAGLDELQPDLELGQSLKSIRNAPNYSPNANDSVARSNRVVAYSTNSEVETGLTLKQTPLLPGVHVIGEPTDDRSAETLRTAADTLEQWRAKHLPNRPLLLLNESLPAGNAIGWHWTNGNVHAITPAPLRNFEGIGSEEFNANAQVSFFYNLTHEFGHSLLEDKFFEGLPPELTHAINTETAKGLASIGTLATLETVDPARAAVVREFNSIKERVLSGEMTAQDFILQWMGPGKAGKIRQLNKHDYRMPPEAPALQLIDKILQRSVGSKTPLPSEQLKGMRERYLSLHEYGAEQVARYAYAKKWDAASPFNTNTLFARAFQSLRDALAKFFVELKREGSIAPNTKFAEWLEGLTVGGDKTVKAGPKAKTKKAAKPKTEKKAPKAKPVEELDHNVETVSEDKIKKYRGLVTGLVKNKTLELGDENYKHLMGLLKSGDYSTFIDDIQPLLEKNVKFEIDDEVPVKKSGLENRFDPTGKNFFRGWRETLNELEQKLDNIALNRKEADYVKFQDAANEIRSEKLTLGKSVDFYERNVKDLETAISEGWAQEPELTRRSNERSRAQLERRFTKLLEYEALLPKQINFEIDDSEGFIARPAALPEHVARRPEVVADAQGEWFRKGFVSKYLKAWFGDWQASPGDASQVVTASGEPLKVYHASAGLVDTPEGKMPFTEYKYGDIGFHFGTVRAAHIRHLVGSFELPPRVGNEQQVKEIGEVLLKKRHRAGDFEGIYIIPHVLNIRNPLIFGDEEGRMWNRPKAFIEVMEAQGLNPFSVVEIVRILAESEQIAKDSWNPAIKYKTFGPLRDALIAKGFDGIRYENTVEGDTTWVAFEPQQVKSLLGNKTFSTSKNMNWELDFDMSKPDGESASNFYKKFGDWMPNKGNFRRALRWVTNLQFKTLQLQQLAHLHPELADLAYMNTKNAEFGRYKGSLQAGPDRDVAIWETLGKENFARTNRFLQEEAEGKELWFSLEKVEKNWVYKPNERTLTEMRKRGIDPDTEGGAELAELILDVKNNLLHRVNEKERVLKMLLARRHGSNQARLVAEFTIAGHTLHEIRKQPFFPQGRFGNYILVIERKKDNAPGYEVVHREAFESRDDWAKAWESASKRKKPDERVSKKELTDTEYVLMSLPQDFIELAASELGLTEKQRDTLIEITQPVRQEKLLKAYDLNRLGIKGYSTDAMRSYANFAWHDANMLAKLKFRSEFNLAIQGINSKLRSAQLSDMPESLEDVERLGRVKLYMERARDFIMAPPNEAHQARALVSIAYLGFNVKTALANFAGLLTTWSDVTSRLGQVEGNRVFLQALRGMWSSIQLTDLNASKPGNALRPELQKGLDQAIEDGTLTQSYAYHLAGAANSSNLYRLPAQRLTGKITHKTIDAAMWAFRLAELGTRRATFIAELDIALRNKGLTFEDAYTEAVTATNKLQNDYSLGNRVPFMRGIKTQSGNKLIESAVPMATIFMSFTQHMAFHVYGGYEIGQQRQDILSGKTPKSPVFGYTMKIWMALLLLAGYEGLPGSENILDLVDIVWKKMFGGKSARQDLREVVQAIGIDPVMASHGLGHNVAGFDVSRSIGLGRIAPGTDVLSKTSTDVDRTVGSLVFDLAGPTGNMIDWMLSTAFSNKPIAEGFRRTPGAIGNVFTAYSWAKDGVRGPLGGFITHDLETGKLRDLTTAEIFGKALGFNPTIVSQNREIMFQQHDARMYWATKRDRLLDDMWKATVQQDREAIADVKKAIVEYNADIPKEFRSTLRLTSKEIFDSRRARQRGKRAEEMQAPAQKRYRGVYKDIKESYSSP